MARVRARRAPRNDSANSGRHAAASAGRWIARENEHSPDETETARLRRDSCDQRINRRVARRYCLLVTALGVVVVVAQLILGRLQTRIGHFCLARGADRGLGGHPLASIQVRDRNARRYLAQRFRRTSTSVRIVTPRNDLAAHRGFAGEALTITAAMSVGWEERCRQAPGKTTP